MGLTGHDLDDASEDRGARTAVDPPAAGREIQGLPGYQGYIFGQRVVECAGNVLELRGPFLRNAPLPIAREQANDSPVMKLLRFK